MSVFTRLALFTNVFLVYLITLSWPESLFWNEVLTSIYNEFSSSYLFDLVFGGVSIIAVIGLTRSTSFTVLNSYPGRILQVFAITLLAYVNAIGFTVIPYTNISFPTINLAGFPDAGLL